MAWGFVRVHPVVPAGVPLASIQVSAIGGTGAYGSFSASSTGPQPGDSVTFRVPAGDLSYLYGVQVTDTNGNQLTVPFLDLTGLSVQAGQITTVDTQTWSIVTGTVRWPNAFPAKSCAVIYGNCQLAPDGWSMTYTYPYDPNNFSGSIQVVAHIGTCAGDPWSCADQGGTRLTFTVGYAPVGPGTTHLDGVLDPSFQFGQICGKVTASAGSMTGGSIRFETNRFRLTGYVGSSVGTTFGSNGNYCTQIASSDYGTMTTTPTITECTAMNPYSYQYLVTIPDGGHVTEDAALSGYSTAAPGSIDGVAQVTAFPTSGYGYAYAFAQGPDNVFACAGGMSGRLDYNGQPGPFSYPSVVSAPWDVFGGVGAVTFNNFYSEWDYFFPHRTVVVQPHASTAVNFSVAGQTVALPVRADLTRWQSEVGDLVNVRGLASTTDGTGSAVSFNPTGSAAVQEPVYLDSAASWSTATVATELDSNYSDFGNSSLQAAITTPFSLTPGLAELPGGSQLSARGLGYWTVLYPAAATNMIIWQANWNATATSAGVPYTETAYGGMQAMHAKLPPATHQGPFKFQWLDPVTFTFSPLLERNLSVEVADYDEVVQDVDGPQMSNRAPQPDTYCPQDSTGNGKKGINDSRGGTTITVSAKVVAQQASALASVTIAGQTVAVGNNGAISGPALLKLGRQAIEILATDTLGNKTSWKRTYTLPTQLNGLGSPLAALVAASTPVTQIPLPSKPITLGNTLPLSLTVTSCGILQKNPDMFVSAPRIIAISRDGQQVSLHDVDSNVATDGIRFTGSSGGTWSYNLRTAGLGSVGTYVLTIAAPDGTRKVAAFKATK